MSRVKLSNRVGPTGTKVHWVNPWRSYFFNPNLRPSISYIIYLDILHGYVIKF